MRIVCLLVLLASAAWGQWERFRGPNGTGVLESAGVPAEFGSGKNLVWRTELPPGHSSPVIGGGHVYLTGVEHERLYTFCVEQGSGRTDFSGIIRLLRGGEAARNETTAKEAPANC